MVVSNKKDFRFYRLPAAGRGLGTTGWCYLAASRAIAFQKT